jgi:TolA-binding protein
MRRGLKEAAALVLVVGTCVSGARAQDGKEADASARGYLSANGMLQRGMHELAVEEYRKFLQEQPRHEKAPHARYGLAVALHRLGKTEEAAKELDGLASRDGFEFAAAAGVLEAQCRLAIGDFDGAAAAAERIPKARPSDELADDAAAMVVEARYRGAKYEQAAAAGAEFTKRHAQSPLGDRVAYFTGLSQLKAGKEADAAREFVRVAEQWPKSPLAEQALLLAGQCAHRSGDTAAAERAYSAVIERDGGSLAPDAMLGLATLRLSNDKPAAAKELLDQLLSEHGSSPRAAEALIERGRANLALDDAQSARADFVAYGKRKGADVPRAAYWQAKAELSLGEPRKAVAALERGLGAEPSDALAPLMMFDLAAAKLAADDAEGATESLRTFLQTNPKHELTPDATETLAAVLHRRGEYAESGKLCEAFRQAYPKHALRARIDLLGAENLFLVGELDKAAAAYAQYLQVHPDAEGASLATFRLGCVKFRQGDPAAAEPLLKQAAARSEKDPVYRPAVLYLGDLCYQTERWGEGVEWLQRYAAFGPEASGADDALLKLGLSLHALSKHDEAANTYRALLAEHPRSEHVPLAQLELGRTLLAAGDREAAEQELTKAAAAKDPSVASMARNQLAVLATQAGDTQRAAELFGAAAQEGAGAAAADAKFGLATVLLGAGKYAEAADAFSAFLDEHADDPRVTEAQAQRAIAMSRGQGDESALAELASAIRKGTKLSPSLLDSLKYEEAACLRKLGRNEEADERLRTLVGKGGTPELRIHAALEMSRTAFEAERYDEAAGVLRSVSSELKADGLPSELREHAAYQLGAAEFKRERYKDAAEVFEGFLQQHAESPLAGSVKLLAGESLFRLGRHEKAIANLRGALETELSERDEQTARLRLGESLAAAQDWRGSEEVFGEFLEKFSSSEQWFQARFGRGWAMENQGRTDEAIAEYAKVVEKHNGPTAARAQFQIGECLFAQGKHEEAARELLKVDILYAYPEWSAAALYEAGRCFEALGQQDKAAEQYRLVREKHAQTQWGKLAAQRLTAVNGKNS